MAPGDGRRPSPSASASRSRGPSRHARRRAARQAEAADRDQVPAGAAEAGGERLQAELQGHPGEPGQVKAALADAAARTYWPTSAPDIRSRRPC